MKLVIKIQKEEEAGFIFCSFPLLCMCVEDWGRVVEYIISLLFKYVECKCLGALQLGCPVGSILGRRLRLMTYFDFYYKGFQTFFAHISL